MKRFASYVAAVLIGVLSNGIAFGNINMPAIISGAVTPIACSSVGGIVFNSAGFIDCSAATVTSGGSITTPAGQNITNGGAYLFAGAGNFTALTNGKFLWRTVGGVGILVDVTADSQFKLFARDGTTPGVYWSGTNQGVSCTVGLLNPLTAIVVNGIVTHC